MRTAIIGTKPSNRTTYAYNEKGYKTEEISYYNDEEYGRLTFFYDKAGSRTRYENGQETWRDSVTYDKEGKLLESARYKDGQRVFSTTYSYDAKGNQTEEIRYTNGLENYRYLYEYDAQGYRGLFDSWI